MKPTKIVKLICPSCGESYDEHEQSLMLDPVKGEINTELHVRKQCPRCRTGLIRRVTKLDKKGKIR